MATPQRPYTAREERIGSVVIRWMSAANAWLFRASRGRLGGRFLYFNAPILLLVTRGRRSGAERTAPLLYLQDGDRYVVVASKGGMSHHPQWYHNLLHEPAVRVEVGNRREAMRARPATESEREELWPRLVEMYPPYASYQARTERRIPVVLLEPAAAAEQRR